MKRIAVIIRASDPERVAEALRGAVGLSLRGARIEVVIGDAAQSAAPPAAGSAMVPEAARVLRDAAGDAGEAAHADKASHADKAAHPGIRRALATLAALGHELAWGDAAIVPALGRADAVEVWS